MDDNKTDFYIQAGLLDKFIRQNPSEDKIATKIILQRIKENDDLLKYFFGQSPSSEWADYLLKNGLFDNPIEIEIVENGYKIHTWPQSNYLKNIAQYKPGIVFDVIQKIQTNNSYIHADLIEALANIQVDISHNFIEIIKVWFQNVYIPNWSRIPESVINLIFSLFKKGQESDAIELFMDLISPSIKILQQKTDYSFGNSIRSRFDLSYIQPDFWKETICKLESFCHEKIYKCLLDIFIFTLKAEAQLHKPEDSSYFRQYSYWRTAIGDTSQDRNVTYLHTLLKATRNSLSRLILQDPKLGILLTEQLFASDVIILNRIALYVIAVNAETCSVQVESKLLNIDLIHSFDYHTEYFELLKLGFSFLPNETKKSVLSVIYKGPQQEKVNELAINYSSNEGEDFATYSQKYIDFWIRDRLWVIKQYLNLDDKKRLDSLLERYGEPSHPPEFLSYISEAHFVVDTSPLSENEIAEYNPEKIFEYIKKWVPGDPHFGPNEISRRGLAQSFAKVIFTNPKRYFAKIERFDDLPSPYISEIFSLARNRLIEKQDFPLDEIINLIAMTIKISNGIKSSSESQTYINERLNVLWFINSLINTVDDISFDQFTKIKNALLVFINDYDPDETRDNPVENYVGYNDPITLALNTIRPIAFNSLIELMEIENKRNKNDAEKQSNNSNIPTEIKEILNLKLDKSVDPSWALHSVFGKKMASFYLLDINWLKNNVDRIFPEESENQKFFLAAWEGFLYYNNPNPVYFSFLREKYKYALRLMVDGKKINSIGSNENQLATHLILDYLWNPYELFPVNENNLLNILFSYNNSNLSSGAIWGLWRISENMNEEERIKYWKIIYSLWKWRINEYILSGFSNEFYSEFQWFSYLLLNIPKKEHIESLELFIEPFFSFINHYSIWQNLEKYLSTQIERNPEKAINIYLLMHEKLNEPEFGQIFYDKEADKILETAIKHPESKKQALKIINIIAPSNSRYRKLYEENT